MKQHDHPLTSRRRFVQGVGAAGLAGLAGCSGRDVPEIFDSNAEDDEPTAADSPEHPTVQMRRDRQAYWFGRYNMNAMLLMSGHGERLQPPEEVQQQLASIAEFDPEEMPDNPYLLKAVYAAGDPHFQQEADFGDLSTLYWDREEMDTTLQPEAQAFTIKKIVGKGLRTVYHRGGKDRFIALVQLQEAMAMAETLHDRLTTDDGLVATRPPDGQLQEPTSEQQAAALLAYASLVLTLTDPDLPIYQELPDTDERAEQYRTWADELFSAVQTDQPEAERETALTIEAYGWYAAATSNHDRRREALNRIQALGEQLETTHEPSDADLADVAWAIYGLGEASRVTGSDTFGNRARHLFFEGLEARWQSDAGIYSTQTGNGSHVYTPATAAALAAALNTIRFIETPGVGAQASPQLVDTRYASFVENVLVRSGMQQAHAIPLAVNPAYLDEEPRDHFTAERIPLSAEGHGTHGLCPVYAAEVTYENEEWEVTDRTFQTADGMLLADLSTSLHRQDLDGFIPTHRLMSNRE